MKGVVIQCYAAFIISLSSYFSGYGVAWPSYTIPILQRNNTILGVIITTSESSLIGSSAMISSCIATFFGAYLSDVIGRKNTYLLALLCHVLSWSLVSTAKTVTQIIIGRLALGVAMSLHVIVGYVFVSEFSQINLRGPLISVLTSFYTLGILFSYISGWIFSYQVINYINLTATVISLLLGLFLKESPAFLVSQGKDREALRALQFYRGASNKEVLEEFTSLQRQRDGLLDQDGTPGESEKLNKVVKKHFVKDMNPWKILYKSTPIRRALITAVIFMFLMVSCGTVAINVYAGTLFRTAVPTLSPDMCSVLLALAVVIGSGLAIVCTDMIGRRALMISTSVLSTICILILAALLHWRWSWVGQWSIPAVILLYCCIFQIGVSNIPFVQLAESFPSKVKSQVNTIASFTMWGGNFLVLVLYEPSVQYFGVAGTMVSYAIVSAITVVTAVLIMKETRRVPLEDILEMYSQGFMHRRSYKK